MHGKINEPTLHAGGLRLCTNLSSFKTHILIFNNMKDAMENTVELFKRHKLHIASFLPTGNRDHDHGGLAVCQFHRLPGFDQDIESLMKSITICRN